MASLLGVSKKKSGGGLDPPFTTRNGQIIRKVHSIREETCHKKWSSSSGGGGFTWKGVPWGGGRAQTKEDLLLVGSDVTEDSTLLRESS